MNVADETCKWKIACSVPLCYRSGQLFSLSKVDLVVQFLPSTRIPVQSVSKSLTTLHFLVLLGDRPNKVWKLYGVGKSSCAPFRSGVQHTIERDLPCRSSKL